MKEVIDTLEKYGAYNAANLDGGSSSELVINNQIVNTRMYYVEKTIEISAAHNLMLSYESKCENLHGHNWKIVVYCKSETLNQDGMVTDFTHIKRIVKDTFDHKYINEVLNVNPSAENIARWICDHVENCYKVSVQESEGNVAIYES